MNLVVAEESINVRHFSMVVAFLYNVIRQAIRQLKDASISDCNVSSWSFLTD